MKNFKNFKFLSFLFVIGLIVTSCVQDDEFDTPPINTVEPDITANISIQLVKDAFGGFEPQEIAPDATEPIYIEGYVVSGDEAGNFFKTLVIQDAPENPTAGISISTEATDLYTRFEPGRKIYFRVDGLFSGEFADLPTIGTQSGDEVGRIGVEDFEERIFRSLESETIVPRVVTISEALSNDNLLNLLVQFENVQFPDSELDNAYADGDFSANRPLENCDNNEIVLRTSGFTDFADFRVAQGNGTLTAVLSIFNGTKQLFIRDTDDVQLNGERCEEEPLTTGIVDVPYMIDFNNQAAGTGVVLSIEDWGNVNVNGGDRLYEVREFSGNKYAQTSAFNSDEDPFEVWLITPGFDLRNLSTGTLNFDTKDGFFNGQALTVAVSTDYTGDFTTATWTELTDATIATGSTSGYPENFTNSGDIDLSSYAGQVVHVRFKYEGGDGGVTTTYQIDNVSVTE